MYNQYYEGFYQNVTQQQFQGPAKQCRHCALAIPSSAKVCPYCQKKQASTRSAIMFFLDLFFFLLTILVFYINQELAAENIDTNTSTKIDSIDSEPNEIETAIEEISVLATVGQYVEVDTWKISLLDAKQYASIDGEYYTDTPAEGKEYLVLFFDVENISVEDNYFNYFFIEANIDSYSVDISFTMNEIDGNSILSGEVAAEKKLKGCLFYEVEKDWSEFEISYKDWTATSNKVATFLVTPDNLTE